MHDFQTINSHLQNLFNEEKYSGALNYLNNLETELTDSPELLSKIYYHIGRILFYENDVKSAKENFMKVLRTNPLDFYSIVFLSRISELEGGQLSAMKLLSHAFELKPSYIQLLYAINGSLQNLKNDERETETLLLKNYIQSGNDSEAKNPKISILVLCYNKLEYTEKCLRSVFENTKYDNFEVIVVDNASVDDTPGYLETYGKLIKYVHSKKNLGFVGGNNLGAQFAEGDFLVFLNNDTEVQHNWLTHLYNTFVYYPNAGAAGSMLIYPDGKLQEAGSVIFQDMSGWNYGRKGDPLDSKFNFVREVDYCSGAALMVKKELFIKLNGFDERYSPAYCEDTDLCFGIRKLGYKVYYNPLSKVVHHEGATAGTDLNSGFKRYQVINAEKFKEKWAEELKLQYPNDPALSYQFSQRKKGKRILIIDDIPPLPDRAAGALRHYHTLTQMLELGYQVTYVHLMGKQYTDKSGIKYLTHFKMRGVEFVWFNYESWWNIRETPYAKSTIESLINSLDLKKRNYDLVYIAFWHIANYFTDTIRAQIPSVPILVDTMDIHYMRELRQAGLTHNTEQKKKAVITKKKEIELYSKVDCITTVTENDRDELKENLPDKSILILTDVHDPVYSELTFEQRKDFLFVGNFNHSPNEDAVIYFVNEIFPLIKEKLPETKFYIVGNNPTSKVKELETDDVIVTGWVPEVAPYLQQCRVSVVPLRFGAGNKGKVGETLSYGLPMVSTSIGAEGMNIISGEHSFIADDVKQFAEYAIELHNNKDIWQKFSQRGQELISSQYSSALMRKRLEYIMSFSSREAFRSSVALTYPNPPKVSIVIVTYNQFDYTKKCLNSVLKHTRTSHEIIVVDNASNDGTAKQIKTNYPEVRLFSNSENKGFPIAANQGINNSIGDFVLILNNDTVVTENWLERMVQIAEEDSTIGMVGPISNIVSGMQIDKDAKYTSLDEMHEYASSISAKNKNEKLFFPRIAFLCTLIKKEVIDKIGGLDERFSPGNYEDDDFCLRAQLAGFKTVIAKDVFIHHFGSKSFKANGENKYAERLEINKKLFSEKWDATPDEIWLQNKKIRSRQIFYPINMNPFTQHFERARVHIADQEFPRALESLAKSREFFGSSSISGSKIEYDTLLNLTGNIALIAGDIEKAKTCFEEELKIVPASSSACAGLGEVFFIQEMYDNAKIMFEWAVKNDSNNLNALSSLAKVNELLGYSVSHISIS